MADTAKLMTAYIAMRDDLAAQKKVFDEFSKKRKADMLKIADVLQKIMETAGSEDLKVKGVGTAFKAKKDFISVEDWNQFLTFIAETAIDDPEVGVEELSELVRRVIDSGVFAFFNKSVSKAVAKEYMDDNKGRTPPGLTYGTLTEIQIRRSSK